LLVVASALAIGAAAAVASSGASTTGGASPLRTTAEPSGSPVRVIVPGRPGEAASVTSADDVKGPDTTVYNTIDATFVRMMIAHHTQALQIAALAPTRARNPQVLAIAERTTAAQAPEILMLKGWLQGVGLDESDDSLAGHDHGSMPGMQSPEAMQALAAARGDGFDRMFVAMMSDHHQGAIDMATDVLKGGKNGRVEEIASAAAAEQAIEISRMREALAG
jgi:uncharacterized protein (DUF305 family)